MAEKIEGLEIIINGLGGRTEEPVNGSRAGSPSFHTDFIFLAGVRLPRHTGEFWTARQRQASPLHEISYRACFKPQLPRFFITALTTEGDLVYDPFSGRGTTPLEAALLGRRPAANDINPLSEILCRPRLSPPEPAAVRERLRVIPPPPARRADIDLSMFFHSDTEAEIVALRSYLARRLSEGMEDDIDRWIRMVATNRLTGHSPGFFSVYTLPPNQAVSPERQVKINRRLGQTPPYRDTAALIMKKTRLLLRGLTAADRANLFRAGREALFLNRDARRTTPLAAGSVRLTVTSPPFLDVVQYAGDNWLRCWFNSLDAEEIARSITATRSLEEWSAVMGEAFRELYRVTAPGGWVAFEVGEVRDGTVRLEEAVVPLGLAAGFSCRGLLINMQRFTKTSNIWGVSNNCRGTNTNRIVLFQK